MPTKILSTQQGQAALEFAIAAPALIALAALGLEGVYLHNFQHRLHAALLQAGRAGIVHHNSPLAIKQHFERALSRTQIQQAAWQIRILSPRPSDFALLSSSTLALSNGALAVIDNDYQFLETEQAPARRAANILELELYYAYRPWHPLLRLAETLLPPSSGHPAHLNSRFVLRSEMRLPMQSHPMLWKNLTDQTVIFYDTVRTVKQVIHTRDSDSTPPIESSLPKPSSGAPPATSPQQPPADKNVITPWQPVNPNPQHDQASTGDALCE